MTFAEASITTTIKLRAVFQTLCIKSSSVHCYLNWQCVLLKYTTSNLHHFNKKKTELFVALTITEGSVWASCILWQNYTKRLFVCLSLVCIRGWQLMARLPHVACQTISNGRQKLHVLHIDFVTIHTEGILILTCTKRHMLLAHWIWKFNKSSTFSIGFRAVVLKLWYAKAFKVVHE